MTDVEWQGDREISLFAVGTTLVRNRWRISRWMLIGAVLAGLAVFRRPALYPGTASFVSQTPETERTSLSSLAGQFGVALPTGDPSLSPEFYASLLKSRVLLLPIVRDTFIVREMNGKRLPFADLFEIKGDSREIREDNAVRSLQRMISVSVSKNTGVVQFFVPTRWRSVSLAIADSLVQGVNDYNERTRQGQAASERKFVEGRLAVATSELRAAEDNFESFLRANRQFANSPELTFQRERFQRDVSLRQDVFTSLTQSYEQARIREVRNTPVIKLVETPWVPTQAQPRGRLKWVLIGALLGAFFATIFSFVSEALARERREGSAEADEFLGTLGQAKGEMLGRVGWFRKRAGA